MAEQGPIAAFAKRSVDQPVLVADLHAVAHGQIRGNVWRVSATVNCRQVAGRNSRRGIQVEKQRRGTGATMWRPGPQLQSAAFASSSVARLGAPLGQSQRKHQRRGLTPDQVALRDSVGGSNEWSAAEGQRACGIRSALCSAQHGIGQKQESILAGEHHLPLHANVFGSASSTPDSPHLRSSSSRLLPRRLMGPGTRARHRGGPRTSRFPTRERPARRSSSVRSWLPGVPRPAARGSRPIRPQQGHARSVFVVGCRAGSDWPTFLRAGVAW